MLELEDVFNKAEELHKEKKYLHALQIYQTLLNVPQFKRKALINLIEIYDLQNQIESAINVFESYLSDNEEDENIRKFYSHFLIRQKKYNEAHDILSRISVKAYPEKNFLMGIVNFYLNDLEIALLNFNEFIRNNRKSELLPEAYLFASKCYLGKNDLEQALENIILSEQLDNNNIETYTTLAVIYYQKEMYFHALEKIHKSMKLNPVDSNSLEWCGRIYYKLREFEKAKKQFELLMEIKQPDSDIFTILGKTCLHLKDFESAIYYFESAINLDPMNESVLTLIAESKAKLKQA